MSTEHRIDTSFLLWLVAAATLIFLGNAGHTTQQGVFFREYLPIADNLLHGNGYAIVAGHPTLYPMWGYPFLSAGALLVGSWPIVLGIIQAVSSVIGIVAFYQLFRIPTRRWHIAFFVPFFAVCSVRWPDAIVAVLLVLGANWLRMAIEQRRTRYAILAGLSLGIINNFRSEYVGLVIVAAAFALLLFIRGKRTNAVQLTVLAFVAIVSLLPWMIYSYRVDGKPRLTATNGGGVLYISLGQLPNNPWNIVHVDSCAQGLCDRVGRVDAYSPAGDSILTAAFEDRIRAHPAAFLAKVAHNLVAVATRGVYTGEYSTLALDSGERDRTLEQLSSASGVARKLNTIRELPAAGAIALVFEKTVQGFFVVVLTCALAILLIALWRKMTSAVLWIIVTLVAYKILLVALVQYEPRHMNAVYMFALGASLVYLIERRDRARKPAGTLTEA